MPRIRREHRIAANGVLRTTLTEREKAILYLLLSTDEDSVLADRLVEELNMTREEWEDLEHDLNEFLQRYLSQRPGGDHPNR